MKSYMDQLRARTEELNKQRKQARAKSRFVDMRVSPEWSLLTEQIETLMRSLPPAQHDRRWLMEELCCRLKGKFKTNPQPMHVGTALRALGRIQKRDWSKAGGDGRRIWVQRK